MVLNRRPQARDTVIRQPRLRDVRPTVAETAPTRRPRRVFSSPYILLFSFVMLIVTGGLLLTTPVASSAGSFTPLDMAFFTAISAITAEEPRTTQPAKSRPATPARHPQEPCLYPYRHVPSRSRFAQRCPPLPDQERVDQNQSRREPTQVREPRRATAA